MDDDDLLVRLIGPRARRSVRNRDLGSLLDMTDDELASTPLSPTCKSRISVVAEVARRHQPQAQIQRCITGPRDVVAICPELRASPVEKLAVLSIDAAGKLLDKQVVAMGAIAHVGVAPREVFVPSIVSRATSIVLVHNHPSGNVQPSPHDIAFTGRMVEAARLLGIELLDHLILGRRAFFSFSVRGLLNASNSRVWNAA